MPTCDRYDGPHGPIWRPVRGCEGCGGTDLVADVDGLWCCAHCGLTALDQGEGR